MDYPIRYDRTQASLMPPYAVHVNNTGLNRYFERYLMQKAISVFKWELPETWSESYFLYTLYGLGYVAVINTDKYGVIPQMGTLTGYNIFYEPTHAVIANPLLTGSLKPQIGRDCELIRLQPDYGGIYDLVQFYANMMALSAESAAINILNSRLAYVFAAKDKRTAESFKKMFDQIASGQPASVVGAELFSGDGKPLWDTFTQNLSQNYIASNILSDLRKWELMFCTDLGIPNANTDKKERLITDEVNANNVEVTTRCEMWLELLQEGCEKVNKMFGLELSVDWRHDPMDKEVAVYAGENDSRGALSVRRAAI